MSLKSDKNKGTLSEEQYAFFYHISLMLKTKVAEKIKTFFFSKIVPFMR